MGRSGRGGENDGRGGYNKVDRYQNLLYIHIKLSKNKFWELCPINEILKNSKYF